MKTLTEIKLENLRTELFMSILSGNKERRRWIDSEIARLTIAESPKAHDKL